MKNITKRLLAALLSTGLLLSVVPAFAEDTEAKEESAEVVTSETAPTESTNDLADIENAVLKDKYAEELALLSGLGIIDDTNLKLTNSITRAEFLALVMKTIKMDKTVTESSEVIFYDVLPTNDYYSAIMSAHKMGLINGDDKGCFNPDSPIDAISALKILVCALDYGFIADAKGGYPRGYLEAAKDLGLSDGITVSGKADWRMAIVMIDNALNTYVSEKAYTYDGRVSVGSGSKTLLEEYYDAVRYSGTVEETNYTLRMKGEKYDGTALQISGKLYTKVEISANECKDLLGKKVIFYLNEETDTIYSISPDPKYNKVTVLDPEDIKSASFNEIRYWNENDKETKIEIDAKNAKFYYNGVRSFDVVEADLRPENGEITLIDVTNDKKADVVIIEDWYEIPVAKCSTTTLESLYNDGKGIDLKKTDMVFYKNGFEITTFYINQYEVARVMLSKDNKYGIAEISGWDLTATVEAVREKNGKHYATLNGTEYRLAESFVEAYTRGDVDAVTPKKGSRYQFVLSNDDVVFAIKRTTLDDFQYGYMVKVVKNSSLDTHCKVKIYGSQGEMLKFDVPENIKVNGKKAEDFFAKVAPTGTYEPQLIMYKLNTNNELVAIKTAVDVSNGAGYDLDNFSKDKVSGTGWVRSAGNHTILNQQVMNDGRTPLFYIPYDLNDEEDYRWVSAYSSEETFNKDKTTVEVFDITPYDERYTDYGRVGAVVVKQTKADYDSHGSRNGYAAGSFSQSGLEGLYNIFVELRQEADDEGEIRWALDYYYMNGDLHTVYCNEDAINNTADDDPYHDLAITDLRYGDLFVMSYDFPDRDNPRIDRFQIYAKKEDYKEFDNFKAPAAWTEGSNDYFYTNAEVLYVDQDMFLYRFEDAEGKNYYRSAVKAGNVWDYSVSEDNLINSNVNNISAGDKIFMRNRLNNYNEPTFLIRMVE